MYDNEKIPGLVHIEVSVELGGVMYHEDSWIAAQGHTLADVGTLVQVQAYELLRGATERAKKESLT